MHLSLYSWLQNIDADTLRKTTNAAELQLTNTTVDVIGASG
jgi:hypothetical protein